MTPEEEKILYDDTGVTPEGDFSLEDILAEFGSSRGQQLLRTVEEEAQTAEPETPAEPPPAPEESVPKPASAPAPKPEPEPAIPPEPRPIPMEEVVSRTVDAVMEERRQETARRPRRGLFSRKRVRETEQLYASFSSEETEPLSEPEEEEEPIGYEEPAADAAELYRREWQKRKAPIPAALCVTLLPLILMGAEAYGLTIPFWTGDRLVQSLGLLGCTVVVALLGWNVFEKAGRMLRRRRCTAELLVCCAMVVAACDCAARLLASGRADVMPYAAVTCVTMVCAMWGGARESRAMYDTFRAAAMDDEPPYLVTETDKGACKQRGAISGFYTAAVQDDVATLWQTALLPVVLVGSLVFAGLGSLGQGRGGDLFLNWSAILTAGATCGLTLCWALPWSRLSRRLQKEGCALAGWVGAEQISCRRTMVVTDSDLFPPGTVSLNGVKLIGEELPRAVSFAASLCREAGGGLLRLFDGMLRSEGGSYREVIDFNFYEEGGYSGTIRGESVLLGTASFMRKMGVRMPGGLNLKTGVFLAVDRQLTAVFAVKYNPAENVDWALRAMRASHITPILAARDPNINPTLVKRKFSKGIRVEYPDLKARVALSDPEQERGLPRALLLREGLLPYAETVVGGRRLCRAVRQSTALALVGSAAGTLLAFYLTFLGSYSLLSPLMLLAFLLLWTLPVLLLADTAVRF